ncbi:MAG TPA: aldehyde dehydrogenase family protein [Verrucomicrobiae bacterium]|nr:aldehyde dehydrogenase family protein [Verrucomicrobiae bacterium]
MAAQIYINGKATKAKTSSMLQIRNPATLESIEQVPDCGADDVNAAVAAAKAAQRDWDKTPAIEKAAMLHEVARRIRADEEGLAHTMCIETGKPIWEARDCIEWVAACFDYYAEIGRASRGQTLPPVARHQVNFTIKEPYGVVAAIAPFNFPLLLMAWKVAPAIMAGNTVVCKPPHQNPLSNLRLANAYSSLPPGVVSIVTGGAQTGSLLVDHPDVNLIAFTGSTAVGRHIASRAGAQLKKVNLELGGVDPFIVFEDADLDVAVPGVAWARLLNAGQVCTASKRIYLVKPIAKEFTERLVQYVSKLNIGDPQKPEVDIGPLISKDALEKVEKQVGSILTEGAKILYGGKRIQPNGLPGYFYEPTVLTNVRHGGICTCEEVFGPVLSLIEVKDADEAIERANDSAFGLGANIYTRSLEYAMKAMDNIKAGTFWVNDPLTDNDAGPFGGMRSSGIGRELGEEGLDAFREPKHVHIDYKMERKSYWYPYSERRK